HALLFTKPSIQPLCGECAVLFFCNHYAVPWLYHNDFKAGMSNADELRIEAENDMAGLAQQSTQGRSMATITNPTAGSNPDIGLFCLLPQPSDNVFDEIPMDDLTYQYEHDDPIPHGRFPEVLLHKYRTFEGAFAYQPCGKDVDLSEMFTCLYPLDRNGDALFIAARAWSCNCQGLNDLPKENTLWGMRAWLLHWYCVADELFQLFGVPATTPDPNWFMPPTVVEVLGLGGNTMRNHTLIGHCEAQLSDCFAASDGPANRDDDRSVASEDDPSPMIVLEETSDEELEPLVFTPTVHTWSNGEPDRMGFVRQNRLSFDSVSRGRVPFEMRLVASQHNQSTISYAPRSESATADLVPEAIEFTLQNETNDWLTLGASYCDIL
ncbi:hypothetical protein EDB81DRAFT_896100, partial [Dactylonectria macrodidyma]